jgi:hypothetical protein
VADRWFFETAVRVHRAGEGAPFTGLKPAGLDVGPVIPTAERALETETSGELAEVLCQTIRTQVQHRHEQAMTLKAHASEGVPAARAYGRGHARSPGLGPQGVHAGDRRPACLSPGGWARLRYSGSRQMHRPTRRARRLASSGSPGSTSKHRLSRGGLPGPHDGSRSEGDRSKRARGDVWL